MWMIFPERRRIDNAELKAIFNEALISGDIETEYYGPVYDAVDMAIVLKDHGVIEVALN